MPSVAKLMREYFSSPDCGREEVLFSRGLILEQDLPVHPTKATWTIEEGPERFVRRFEFDNRLRLIDFVNEVLRFEDEMGHHGELKISGDAVDVAVHTHTVERITELDQEYIKHVDKIHQDVLHYGYGDHQQ